MTMRMASYTEDKSADKDEHYTPRKIFWGLNCVFDLDPCSPGADHWVPAKHVYTEEHDGLLHKWFGMVWLNNPWTGRLTQVPWLEKFIEHGNGIGICAAYTSSDWFQRYIFGQMDMVCFPTGRIAFLRPGEIRGSGAGLECAMYAKGRRACKILKASNLGWCVAHPNKMMPASITRSIQLAKVRA